MNKIAIYSNHLFEKPYLIDSNKEQFELVFIDEPLSIGSVQLAAGCKGVTVFTSDDVSAPVLEGLKELGIEFVATRSAGFDHINIEKAKQLGIRIANVPEYSPHAIGEHAVAMMLALCRHLVESDQKVKANDFTINSLTGFNLHYKTAGIIGTGRIGAVVCKILYGFGCKLLGYDIKENELLVSKYGLKYTTLEELCSQSDIISLHTPLNEHTSYMINGKTIDLMKQGVMLINTSRGKLIETAAVMPALQSGKIGYLGLDVYEKEKGIFFHDHSTEKIKDEALTALIGMKNVLITSHHAFLTKEALKNIADTTLLNIDCFVNNKSNPNELGIS
ncbi:2-hydroxyacid dehydrogenase [soil metagenome]